MKQTMLLTFFLGLPLASCTVPATGSFEVGEPTLYEDCVDSMFPFEPSFLAARDRPESTGIFFQSRGGNFQNVDLIYFEVFQPDVVPGEPLDLGLPGVVEPEALGELQFGASCPEVLDSFFLDGQVVFEEFNDEPNEVMEGELLDAQILSAETGEVIADELRGEFSFVIKRGPPYEEFKR